MEFVPVEVAGADERALIPVWTMMDLSMTRVLEKIAKGLYFMDEVIPVPLDVEISTFFSPDPERLIAGPLADLLAGVEQVDVGNNSDVVTYWRAVTQDGTKASMTWVVFYRKLAFLLACIPKEAAPSAD